jgi:hypothetical protein
VRFTYAYAAGTDLLNSKPVVNTQELTLAAWDVAIIEESSSGPSGSSKRN